VEVRPARQVKRVNGYDAVILGGSVYLNRRHRDARRFARRLAGSLILRTERATPNSTGSIRPIMAKVAFTTLEERHRSRIPGDRARAQWLLLTHSGQAATAISTAEAQSAFTGYVIAADEGLILPL
jgi:hypothetical protein